MPQGHHQEGEKPSMQSEKTLISHIFMRLFSRIHKEYMTQLKKEQIKAVSQLKQFRLVFLKIFSVVQNELVFSFLCFSFEIE